MPASSKTVVVCISGAFRAMHAERAHLVTVVFPEVHKHVEQLGVEFFAVILCWSFGEEAKSHIPTS